MSKYLTTLDINYPNEDALLADSRAAAALYLYLLNRKFKIPAGGISKVILQKASAITEHTVLDICTYGHPLHHLAVLSANASAEQAQKALINEITDALLALAKLKNWDNSAINELHAEVVKRQYRFEGTVGKAKKNPSKTLTASAAWRTDKYLNIGIALQKDNKSPETFIRVTRLTIALGLFESLLGPLEWVGEQTIQLFHTNKRDYWEIDTRTDKVEFHYPRAESGNAHGQYDLAKMYLDGWIVEQDIEQAKKWLKASAAQNFAKAVKLLQRIEAGETNLADPLKNSMN